MVFSSPALHVSPTNSGCFGASLNFVEYEKKPNDQRVNTVKLTESMGIFDYKHELFIFVLPFQSIY